jgi:hypothetical protein
MRRTVLLAGSSTSFLDKVLGAGFTQASAKVKTTKSAAKARAAAPKVTDTKSGKASKATVAVSKSQRNDDTAVNGNHGTLLGFSPEVVRLLNHPAVVGHLRGIAAAADTPSQVHEAHGAAAPIAPPATKREISDPVVDANPPADVQPSSIAEQDRTPTDPANAAAVGIRATFGHLASVAAAVNHQMSPWTAPFTYKQPFNVRGNAVFAAHHRRVLEASFRGEKLSPSEVPVRWVSTYFASHFNATLRPEADSDPALAPITLPPYESRIDITGETVQATADDRDRNLQRRTFRPLAAYDTQFHSQLHQTDPPLAARCGESGKFFSREEIVDALLSHAAEKQFKNPFWITPQNKRLATGFLELKAEQRPILAAASALVFPASRLPSEGAAEPRALLNSAWLDSAKRMPGMNAFTGLVSENPALSQGEFKDGWVTLDQLMASGMQICRSSSSTDVTLSEFAFNEPSLDGGKIVVVQELALFNADQLEKPGRLALITDGDTRSGDLFQPLF